MKVRDLSELALRNLREAVLRNSLTTLGVTVGVASLVAMVSLGVGLQELATKRLSNTGLFDTVLVTQRRTMPGMRRTAATAIPEKEIRVLNDDARNEFAKLPNVVEVYPQIRFPTEIRYNGSAFSTMVAGVPESSRSNGSFDGMKGSFFSGPAADEAILQIELAKELSPQTDALIGKDLVVRYAEREALPPQASEGKGDAPAGDSGGFSIVPREKNLRIVGIVETEPAAGFGGFGSGRLLIPQQVAAALRVAQVNDLRDAVRATGRPQYASLTVRAKNPRDVTDIETAIKNMGFGTFSLLDATRNLRLFFTIFDLLLAIFGSLALAVATLGIINTLVMAILERRREIGILKALGAADGDVKQLFFLEAGVMGLLGGVFGVGFGWFIGRAVTWGTNLYLHRQNLPSAHVFAVPMWLVLAAVAFSVLVSLAAGLYPATRAAKLNPVEALRYE
ncbi:MAG TPA: FtsX-like permease family protein [Candidatus Acidoferrum sp.]|nr:FtsX-like permease family protein [Candidatus Acidoferrum sp.]